MAIISAEDRAAMRESFHRLLKEASSESAVRKTMDTETGFDPDLWGRLAELGMLGLLIDGLRYGAAGTAHRSRSGGRRPGESDAHPSSTG